MRSAILLDVIVAEGRAAAANRPARAEVAAAADAPAQAAPRGTAEAAEAVEHAQRHYAHHRQDDQRKTVR